ncbi:hypothetical protein C8R47DRAFT_1213191 [Mycena vitilis]|nr:hypothetical protein C8R47DRAFT_1213191 [Mycena vitilis]
MPIPPPVLVRDSVEDFQCRFSCTLIEHAWRMCDRPLVRSYGQFLLARTRLEARKACCHAIASRRSAMARRFHFRRWLEQHATGIAPPQDIFGGAPHLPGMWHQYHNSDGTWGPEGGIMDASRWIIKRDPDEWTWNRPPRIRRHGLRDPDWDGAPVPKTPGKAKRRRQRRRDELALLAALRDAQQRAMGWGGGGGWGPGDSGSSWLSEAEWDEVLAEPRAAVERAKAALTPYYNM